MNYQNLIQHFGTQERVAAALGVKQPSVSLWKERGIPYLRQLQIQFVTGGILQAHKPNPSADSEISKENLANQLIQQK